MTRVPLLLAALAFVSLPASSLDAPPKADPASAFSAADQKLIDRYTAALKDKYGFSAAALENGALAVTPAGGEKVRVEIKDAKTEDDIEAALLARLKPAKAEAGDAKTPVYVLGTTLEELFKPDNPFKVQLDLKQAMIVFQVRTETEIRLNAGEKAARRVFLRKTQDGTLAAVMDGEGYSYAAARVKAGGTAERDATKTGEASPFFAMNAWMQKMQKASDPKAEQARYPKLTDAGSRHPAFEKLMSQVQSGLTGEKLGAAFEGAAERSPAELQARAQAAQELAGSGYGAGAHWKINSNGKYAAPDGTMTLLVRPNGPPSPGGKIEEVAVTVRKDAKGQWDLGGAAAKVSKILLQGSVATARAEALKTAATPTAGEAVAEVIREADAAPAATLTAGGALGLPAPSLLADAGPKAVPAAAIERTRARAAAAEHLDQAAVAAACAGKPGCAPAGPVEVRRESGHPEPPVANNTMCALSHELPTLQQRFVNSSTSEVPDWMRKPAHFGSDGGGAMAYAVGCSQSNTDRGPLAPERHSDAFAAQYLKNLVECNPRASGRIAFPNHARFQLKDGARFGACSEAAMRING